MNMFTNKDEFYAAAQKPLQILNDFLDKYFLTEFVTPDHIGYKCSSSQSFEEKRKILELESGWLYQTMISDRRITTIKLTKGLETLAGNMSLVELSDQKPDRSQGEGFDHIEIYPTEPIVNLDYRDLVDYLTEKGLPVNKKARSRHTTHDIQLENGFTISVTEQSLVEKIKKEQMQI